MMWLTNIVGDLTPKPRRSHFEAAPKQRPRKGTRRYFTGVSFPENSSYVNHRAQNDYFSLELEH